MIRISLAVASIALVAAVTPGFAADYDTYGRPYGYYSHPTYSGYAARYGRRYADSYSERTTTYDDGYSVTHTHVVGWGYDAPRHSFHRGWNCDD